MSPLTPVPAIAGSAVVVSVLPLAGLAMVGAAGAVGWDSVTSRPVVACFLHLRDLVYLHPEAALANSVAFVQKLEAAVIAEKAARERRPAEARKRQAEQRREADRQKAAAEREKAEQVKADNVDG